MSNDTLLPQLDLLEQKDAIKNYLDSLLDVSPKPTLMMQTKSSKQSDERIPQWAKSGFTALSFRSAGLHLYVPVSFIRGIKNIGGRINKPGRNSDLIKGIVVTKQGKIVVIDTEKLVNAGKDLTVDYSHPDAEAYVILLGDGTFGLSCDTIGKVKQVNVEDVYWRASNTQRRWAAGMMKNEVAGLIDARRVALALSMDSALV